VGLGSVSSAPSASAAPAVSAASAAAALPGLVPISAETAFDSQAFKPQRVFCPPGLQVVGGSYELIGAEGSVVLDDFIPSADNLLVSAGEIVGPGEKSDGTTANWKIRATAMCANPLPGYSIQITRSDFTRTTSQSARAFCPAGTSLVSGGTELSNGFGQVSTVMLDLANTSVEAVGRTDTDGYSGSWSISAYAICANHLPGWSVPRQLSPVDVFQSRSETAVCSPGQVAIGVGWQTFGTLVGIGDRYFTRASFSTGANPGVTVSATGQPTSTPWELAAYAVCVNN
jgi:hypothetical protein